MQLKAKIDGVFQNVAIEGLDGMSAYQIAVKGGYKGSEADWLDSLIGLSAYEVAKEGGYEGTQEEWLESLKGESVPKGGTAGQFLIKNSSTDYDYSWKDRSTSVNVSVATSAWAADATYTGYGFKATVTATGVTASNNIVVGLTATATLAQEEACSTAGVQCKAQAANQITLYAKTKPAVALPITVMIMS